MIRLLNSKSSSSPCDAVYMSDNQTGSLSGLTYDIHATLCLKEGSTTFLTVT